MKKRYLSAVMFAVLLGGVAVNAHAVSGTGLPAKKQTSLGMYLSAEEAQQMKAGDAQVLFIDVRTRAEVAFLGMPTSADANIPFMLVGDWDRWNEKKRNFELVPNSQFQMQVDELVRSRGLDKGSRIIVMCRSGSRSAKAANLLAKVGYTNVYTVVDGFEGDKAKEGEHKGERVVNGWRNAGLPWSYKLDRSKMYGDMLQ